MVREERLKAIESLCDELNVHRNACLLTGNAWLRVLARNSDATEMPKLLEAYAVSADRLRATCESLAALLRVP